MALKSTIFRANLQVSDMDRNHYGSHSLTLARHPSETDERMMVRLLAFALNASDALSFGNGLSADDEPDLWQKDLTGSIELWVDVGLPDEKLIRKACGRADKVIVYAYGGRSAEIWWNQSSSRLEKAANLTVMNIAQESTRALAELAQRSMQLQCIIQDGTVLFSGGDETVPVMLEQFKAQG